MLRVNRKKIDTQKVCEHFLCLEPMLVTPLYRLVGKGKDGPCVPELREDPNEAILFVCFSLCVAIHLMDRIDVIVSCMIIREPMSLLKPLYRDCVGTASQVHNGTHSSSVHGL